MVGVHRARLCGGRRLRRGVRVVLALGSLRGRGAVTHEEALEDLESRIVWIFGGPRTGSTWLMELLVYPLTASSLADPADDSEDRLLRTPHAVPINEPYLGAHLAPITTAGEEALSVYTVGQARSGEAGYFFDERYARARGPPLRPLIPQRFSAQGAGAWEPHLRRMILERFSAQVADAERKYGAERPLVVIKEPNGSTGAPLILRSLPRSRAIFLIRDGRDVVDSLIDAVANGAWLGGGPEGKEVATPAGRLSFLRRHASLWVHRIGEVERALAEHSAELSTRVRYEELRAEPLARLTQIMRWLGLDPETAEAKEAVASSSFEGVPAESRGSGSPLRFASPGRWREGLSAAEQEAVMEIMGPRLALLGYEV